MKFDKLLVLTSASTITVRGLGAVLALVVTIILGRLLGPSGLGVYALIATVIMLLAVPIGSGWNRLLTRSASSSFGTGDWRESIGIEVRGYQFTAILTAAVVALVLGGRSLGLEPLQEIGVGTFVAAAVVLGFDQMSALRTAVLRSCDRSALGSAPEMVFRPLGQLACLGVLLIFGVPIGVQEAFYSLATGSIVGFVLGAAVLRRVRPSPSREQAPEYRTGTWAKSSAILGGNALMNVLNAQISLLLLGALAATAEVGLYRVAVQVSMVAALGYTALNMISAQRFAYHRAVAGFQETSSTAHFLARLAFILTLPVLIILLFFGEFLFSVAFGPAFEPAAVVAIVLVAGQVINSAVGMAASLLITHGLERLLIRTTLVGLIVNVALSVALIPYLGAVGAAIASCTSMVVLNGLLVVLARLRVGVDTSIIGLSPAEPLDRGVTYEGFANEQRAERQ